MITALNREYRELKAIMHDLKMEMRLREKMRINKENCLAMYDCLNHIHSTREQMILLRQKMKRIYMAMAPAKQVKRNEGIMLDRNQMVKLLQKLVYELNNTDKTDNGPWNLKDLL